MCTELVPVEHPKLVRMEDACRLLAEAKTLNDVKFLRDRAQLFAHYAKERGYGIRAQNDGAEIKVRAERRLGEMLAELDVKPGPKGNADTLSGILGSETKQQAQQWASRWQRIAGIPAEAFEAHIGQVREAGQELTTAGVLRLAKELAQPGKQDEAPLAKGCIVEDLVALVAAGRRFGTIYVDPPWAYSNQATRASTDNHYRTMTLDEIAGLPVKDLAADLCHLHLWTTNAFLPDAFALADAWGFAYQGFFVWCKPQMGIGNCWRVSHEFLLLAIRGEPRKFLEDARDLKSWGVFDRGRHSSKPEQVRLMIEKASPGPFLELFARIPAPGWTTWGDEIERDNLFARRQEEV